MLGRAWTRAAVVCGLAGVLAALGCNFHLLKTRKPAAAPRQGASKQADSRAQQQAYEDGLRFFSQEKYREAKQAWLRAVRLGPGSEVGRKAQEHLQKTEQILQNLREIERR